MLLFPVPGTKVVKNKLYDAGPCATDQSGKNKLNAAGPCATDQGALAVKN